MLILTNHPEQTQQGGGFQLQSNTLQNSRVMLLEHFKTFEEGVEKCQQSTLQKSCLIVSILLTFIVQGYYYQRILLYKDTITQEFY